MRGATVPTSRNHQQELYEDSYRSADAEYGIPDRKIAGDKPPQGQRILCIGCGAGNDVWYLAHENEVVGMDYANSGLEVAARHGIHVFSLDLNASQHLPFDDGSFDIVVCKDVLEHLLDPVQLIRECGRVLRDAGHIVISVPNHFWLPMRIRLLFGNGVVYKSVFENHSRHYDEWNYMHIRFFTYRGFRAFLREARLNPVRWFWDFGLLAHYHQPEMWIEPQIWKRDHGIPLSRRGKFGLAVIRPLWAIFNTLFPRPLRRLLVGVAPGLLCGGFYVWAAKDEPRESGPGPKSRQSMRTTE